MKSIINILVILLLSQQTACSYLMFWRSDEPEDLEKSDAHDKKQEKSELNPKQSASIKSENNTRPIFASSDSTVDDLALKQAKLLARLEELEKTVRKQKEKLRVLEKGLTLGLTPSGLESATDVSENADQELSDLKDGGDDQNSDTNNLSDDYESYLTQLSSAKQLFRSGKYGKAYIAFARLDKTYDDTVTKGVPIYWIGRCWYRLKEYQSARTQLNNFVAQYPASKWTPSAKFYLARSEWELGLREMSVKRYQEIVRQYPEDGTAEAARQILRNMDRAL